MLSSGIRKRRVNTISDLEKNTESCVIISDSHYNSKSRQLVGINIYKKTLSRKVCKLKSLGLDFII